MLGGCGVKKEKEADSELPKIVIGMDYFEPYSYQASDGEYKGIDVELAVSREKIRIPTKISVNTSKHAFLSNFFFCT